MDKLIYKDSLPSSDSFYSLYKTTGWDLDKPKTKDILSKSLFNTWYSVSAYSGDKLVGFGRVISDGYLHAYINEMIIDPLFQQQGIGREILHRLLTRINDAGIEDIQLFCAKGKRNFYLKNNFIDRPNDAPGMQYQVK